jgi:hypothetical protein
MIWNQEWIAPALMGWNQEWIAAANPLSVAAKSFHAIGPQQNKDMSAQRIRSRYVTEFSFLWLNKEFNSAKCRVVRNISDKNKLEYLVNRIMLLWQNDLKTIDLYDKVLPDTILILDPILSLEFQKLLTDNACNYSLLGCRIPFVNIDSECFLGMRNFSKRCSRKISVHSRQLIIPRRYYFHYQFKITH